MSSMSDEKRRELSARMKAKWAAKKAAAAIQETINEPLSQGSEPSHKLTAITSDNQNLETILKQTLEAIQTLAAMQTQSKPAGGIGVNGGGRLTGSVVKFALDPALYPDPSERLSNEPKLERFAFKQNYELRYTVQPIEYDTIDHIHMREPRFQLDLIRKMYDPDSGELTNGRYVVCRMILFIDPTNALMLARQHGFDPDAMDETEFLNEMRYIQMRDWLLEAFYPPKPQAETARKDMVIDGKLVEFFEVASEDDKTKTLMGSLEKTDKRF